MDFMKICMIASRLFSGGFTTSMLNMIEQLKQQGVMVDLLFLDAKNHDWPLESIEGLNVLPIQHTKLSKYDFKAKYYLRRIKKLQQAMKDEQSVEEVRNTQLAIMRYVIEWLPKYDLSAYDCVVSWEELTCNYFLAFNVKAKKKIGYMQVDYTLAGFDAKIDLFAFERLDQIVNVLKPTNETMIQRFPSLKNRCVYCPHVLNPVDLKKKENEDVSTYEKSSFDIVTIARLDIYHKGLDRLVRVVDALNQKGYAFQWYLIGEGKDRPFIEEMIRERNITNLHLLGNQKNPYPYLKKSDVFVLLSNYEGKPMVVTEALYLNHPVIVTDYDAASEQVSHGVDGFIVDKNDEEQIVDLLAQLIEDPSQLKVLQDNLMQETKEKYVDCSCFLRLMKGE